MSITSVTSSVFKLDSSHQRTALSRLEEANAIGASKISHKRKTTRVPKISVADQQATAVPFLLAKMLRGSLGATGSFDFLA